VTLDLVNNPHLAKKISTFQKSYLDLVRKWRKSRKNTPNAIATPPHAKPLGTSRR
jgi:hypothetical protein